MHLELRLIIWSIFLFLFFGATSQQKNVLFIAIDDLKSPLNIIEQNRVHTPNLDRLAAMGTTFANASCQYPVCAPSRASLLTGKYPDKIRVFNLNTKIRDMNPDIITLPQYLKSNGYITTGAGKMFDARSVDGDLDGLSWSLPYVHDVDETYYYDSIKPFNKHYQDPIVPIEYAAFREYMNLHPDTLESDAMKLFPNARPTTEALDLPDNAYPDGATTQYIMQKMEELADGPSPFFLSVGYIKPHLPFTAPKKYWDLYQLDEISIHPNQEKERNVPKMAWRPNLELTHDYSDIPKQKERDLTAEEQKRLIHGYLACTSYIDAQIGELLNKLNELGLQDNTTIVIWGDHGWHLGDHRLWSKFSLFEEAVISPLIIVDPDVGSVNNKTFSPVEFVDVFPTLSELLNLGEPQGLDGTSLVPVMQNPNTLIREAAISQYPRRQNELDYMGYTLRNERYRYTKWLQMDFYNGERYGPVAGFQLYDLETDPFEMNNLIGDTLYDQVIKDFELLFKKRNVAQETPGSYIDTTTCNDFFIAPDGKAFTTSGIYSSKLMTPDGQDSIITIDLTFKPTFDQLLDSAICEREVLQFGSLPLDSPGIYTEVFNSVSGCDSTVTLLLTVNPTFSEVASRTICQGDSIQLGNQTITEPGMYSETFIGQTGCDSLVTLNVTVNSTYNVEVTRDICEGDVFQFGGKLISEPGYYTQNFNTVFGCDSTVHLTLVLNPIFEEIVTKDICEGESYVIGPSVLDSAGIYIENFISEAGCDSLVILDLTVNEFNKEVEADGNILHSLATNASILWYDCNKRELVPEQKNPIFSPTLNGSYAAILQNGDCTDTTACYTIDGILGVSINDRNDIRIFPNPVNKKFIVLAGQNQLTGNLIITDMAGNRIHNRSLINENKIEIELDASTGVYILLIEKSSGETSVFRLYKN